MILNSLCQINGSGGNLLISQFINHTAIFSCLCLARFHTLEIRGGCHRLLQTLYHREALHFVSGFAIYRHGFGIPDAVSHTENISALL